MLSDTLTLARRLGATVFTYKGKNVVETILRFAREYRVGHIVIGRPHPVAGLGRLLGRRDVAERLIRRARGLTVVVADNRIEAAVGAGGSGPPLVREAMEDGRPASRSAFEGASIRALAWREPMSKEEAYRLLLRDVLAGRRDVDEGRVWGLLRSREAQGSTYLAEDLALPHARIEGLDEPILGVASAAKGIHEPESGRTVRVVFLLLSPAQPEDSHVRLLAELGAAARDDAFLQAIAAATDAKVIVSRVREALLGD